MYTPWFTENQLVCGKNRRSIKKMCAHEGTAQKQMFNAVRQKCQTLMKNVVIYFNVTVVPFLLMIFFCSDLCKKSVYTTR